MDSILIIDDDPLIRSILEEMVLQEWPDLTVLLATDGLEGVTLAVEKKPGVILLDGMMPVMDGFTAARRLRQMPDTRSIPIIAITSDGGEGEISTGLRSLCDDGAPCNRTRSSPNPPSRPFRDAAGVSSSARTEMKGRGQHRAAS
jgi:CheY-like chemotaxis protein